MNETVDILERRLWIAIMKDCFGSDIEDFEIPARDYLLSQGFTLLRNRVWLPPQSAAANMEAILPKEFACMMYLKLERGYGGLSEALRAISYGS